MNSYVAVAFLACLAVAKAGVIHDSSTKILEGSTTTLIGPERRVISTSASGDQIIYEDRPGFITDSTAPILARTAPILARSPAVTYFANTVAHPAPALTYAAPSTLVAKSAYDDSTIVAGPAGTIATGTAAHAIPIVAHSRPAIAYSSPVLTYKAAHGYDGQYVRNYNTYYYNEGSYKLRVY